MMEILRFDGGGLKITLTKEELALYEIDLLRAKDDGEKMRRACRAILALTSVRTGESYDPARCVQMYPCRDGGCEIYVQRAVAGALPALPPERRVGRYLCVFDDPSVLSGVCDALKNAGESLQVWIGPDGMRYLLSTCSGSSRRFLEEYGRKCSFDPRPYLSEHLGARRVDTSTENNYEF